MLDKSMPLTKETYLPKITYRTFINFTFAITIFIIFSFLGLLNIEIGSYKNMFYSISNLFLLFLLFEVISTKSLYTSLFLLLLGLPIHNYLISINGTWTIVIYPFSINYFLVCITIIVIKFFLNFKEDIKMTYTILIPFSLVLILAITSILHTVNIYITINSIIYGLLIPYFLCVFVYHLVKDYDDSLLIYQALVVVMFYYNLLNITLENTGLKNYMGSTDRVSGIFNNPNFYAPVLLVSVMLSLYLLYYYKNKFNKFSIFYLISLLLSIYLLLSTGSRTSVIAISIGTILFYIQLSNRSTKIVMTFVVILLSIILFTFFDMMEFFRNSSFSSLQRVFTTLDTGEQDARTSVIWKEAIKYIKENKLILSGVGFGIVLYDQISRSTPHNSFLHLSLTIGLLGSIMYHYIIIKGINIFSFYSKNIYRNISKIIIIILLIQMIITGYRLLIYNPNYPIGEVIPQIGVHFDVILLWILIGVSLASKSIYNKNTK